MPLPGEGFTPEPQPQPVTSFTDRLTDKVLSIAGVPDQQVRDFGVLRDVARTPDGASPQSGSSAADRLTDKGLRMLGISEGDVHSFGVLRDVAGSADIPSTPAEGATTADTPDQSGDIRLAGTMVDKVTTPGYMESRTQLRNNPDKLAALALRNVSGGSDRLSRFRRAGVMPGAGLRKKTPPTDSGNETV